MDNGDSKQVVRITAACDEGDHGDCKMKDCVCPCHRQPTGMGNWETR